MSYKTNISLKNVLVHLFTITASNLNKKTVSHFNNLHHNFWPYSHSISSKIFLTTCDTFCIKTLPTFIHCDNHNFLMSIKYEPSLVFFSIRCNLISCVLVQQFLHHKYVHNSHKCMEINSIQQHSIVVTWNATTHLKQLFFFYSTFHFGLLSHIPHHLCQQFSLWCTEFSTLDLTNIYYIHTSATVLKQKSPTTTFEVKNLFCGHVT
jgi:hypothetical protein